MYVEAAEQLKDFISKAKQSGKLVQLMREEEEERLEQARRIAKELNQNYITANNLKETIKQGTPQ